MAPLYILLAGIIVIMTVVALPTIITDARNRHRK
jgi:hypothetical protein